MLCSHALQPSPPISPSLCEGNKDQTDILPTHHLSVQKLKGVTLASVSSRKRKKKKVQPQARLIYYQSRAIWMWICIEIKETPQEKKKPSNCCSVIPSRDVLFIAEGAGYFQAYCVRAPPHLWLIASQTSMTPAARRGCARIYRSEAKNKTKTMDARCLLLRLMSVYCYDEADASDWSFMMENGFSFVILDMLCQQTTILCTCDLFQIVRVYNPPTFTQVQ